MLKNRSQAAKGALTFHVGVGADIEVFMAIECSAFAQDRISRADYQELAQSKNAAMLIARFHGSAVGAMVLKRQQQTGVAAANLYSLAVVPGFRKIGIGRTLLSRAIALSRAWSVQRLCLEVRPDNRVARDLYTSMGFVAIGQRDDWYADGAPAICMHLEFDADQANSVFGQNAECMAVSG